MHTRNTNLRVRGVGADVVDAPGDLEVEDGVEGVLAAVDNVRRQLHLLPAADDVRPFAERFMRSFVQGLPLTWTLMGSGKNITVIECHFHPIIFSTVLYKVDQF